MTAPYNPRTPGITVQELAAFPPSVAGVSTAIPAFLGYTEKAAIGVTPVSHVPVLITSMADYAAFFGAGPTPQFTLGTPADATKPDVTLGGAPYDLVVLPNSQLYLYGSLQLYFMNGGGACYVVSIGSYASVLTDGVKLDNFIDGLNAVKEQLGPTMLLAPDAVLLAPDAATADNPVDPTQPISTDYGTFAAEAAAQCYDLKDRMVILDVYGANKLKPPPGALANTLATFVPKFRDSLAIQQEHCSYAATYFPFLATNLVAGADVTFAAFDLSGGAADLTAPAVPAKPAAPGAAPAPPASGVGLATLQRALAAEADLVDPIRSSLIKSTMVSKITASLSDVDAKHLNQSLTSALPGLALVYAAVAAKLNIMPPSGAIAGLYVANDASRGVWEAPANMPLVGVVRPTLTISDLAQEDLNAPLNGKAINCIRSLPGRGNLVWGARTMDANSNDFRYVQIRRALIYMETSIKIAMNRFVFEGNVDQTWASVTAMINSFLNDVWSQGGLMGLKSSEAYTVQCGRGLTMTGDDILAGRMIVNVLLQLVHPAEFILLQFKQEMGGATTA